MKKIVIFILLIINVLQAKAINIDSLKTLANAKSGEAKTTLLNDFSTFLVQNKQLSAAQELAELALSNAESTGAQDGIATAKENLAMVSFMRFDNTTAGKYLTEALRIRDASKDHKAIAKTKTMLGRVFLQQQDFESATQQLTRAIEMSQSVNDKVGEAEASKYLGDTYVDKKIYGKARENYQKSMDIFIAANEPQKAADIASNLGNIVSELADYDGALAYYQTALDLNTATNNLPNVARDLIYLANTHANQGNFEETKHFAEMATSLLQEQKNIVGQAQINAIFGKVYEAKDDKINAEKYLQNASVLAASASFTPGVQDVFLDISTTYRAMGNFEKALEYMNLHTKSKDNVAAAEKNKALLEMTTRYESEFASRQKEQQITLLELEKSNGQKKIWLLLMLAFALAGGGFLMYKNYKTKKKDNELLSVKNEEIVSKNALLDDSNNKLNEQRTSLEVMNDKLRVEMAERESVEKISFDRDNFLANVSNQMRTPINVISGLSHLLLDQKPIDHQIEHLRTLQFSANSLLVFINDMLDFSKIEAGKLNPDFREFEPHKILTEIRERFSLPTQNKGIKLNFHVHDGIPNRLLGDPARLNQVISNILQFATHTTDNGYIDVKIDPIPVSGKDLHLEITVIDSGNGVSQHQMDEMLRKFSYAVEDSNGGMSQIGFGLAIMKRLVELQNGTVEASSMEGIGTKIRVVLPFKLTDSTQLNPKKFNIDYAFPGAKVLVVEDNKINQMVVVKMLQKAHVRVSTADNGALALEKIALEDFDLILMDIQMPVMDGYLCTSKIRKLDSQSKREMPIVALTASPYLTETDKAKLFGMNDYIGKPFSAEELMEKVSRFLEVGQMMEV